MGQAGEAVLLEFQGEPQHAQDEAREERRHGPGRVEAFPQEAEEEDRGDGG